MKRAFGIRLWALVITAIAYCLLPAATFAEPSPRQISVTGQAEQNFAPDKADVFVAVEGRGKTLAEAKKQHDELLKSLHQVVAKFSISKENVKTLSDSINPQYDYVHNAQTGGKQVLRGYEASHRLQITLKDLTKTGEFINALVAKNIDRIEQVQYGLQDSEEAEMKVTLAAVKNAKIRASRIMNALDSSLGKVLNVSADGGGYHPRPMPMMAMAKSADMMAAPEAAEIPAGDVSISKNVTIQFEIQ